MVQNKTKQKEHSQSFIRITFKRSDQFCHRIFTQFFIIKSFYASKNSVEPSLFIYVFVMSFSASASYSYILHMHSLIILFRNLYVYQIAMTRMCRKNKELTSNASITRCKKQFSNDSEFSILFTIFVCFCHCSAILLLITFTFNKQ